MSSSLLIHIHRGADIKAPDTTWQATPLVWASVGSGERPPSTSEADWVATIQTFIAAGARTDDAWIADKPLPRRRRRTPARPRGHHPHPEQDT